MASPGKSDTTLYQDVTTIEAISNVRIGVTTIFLMNSSSDVAWVQIFAQPAADVSVGTTVPMLTVPLVANNGFDTVDFGPNGALLEDGLSVAATTTALGSTASAAGVHVQVFCQ